MRTQTWIKAILLLVALPAVAAAQEIPCARGPCMRPDRPGTHFLAEVNGGGTLGGNLGLAVEGVVGVGGKFRGFPLRFYLVTEVAYASTSQDGALAGPSLGFSEERSYRDLALGLRTYVPIFGPVRLFLDLMGGGSHVAATLERDNLYTLSASDWFGMGQFAGGIQLRVLHHLSVGMRYKLVLTDDPLSNMRQVVGIPTPLRSSVTMGLTWHF